MKLFGKEKLFILLCSVGLVSCDDPTDQEQVLKLDLSTTTSISIEVSDDMEADCTMAVGTEMIIIVTHPSESPCKWVSADTSIATVDQNTIKAVGVGKTKITDENHPNHVINVVVTE